MQLLPPSDSTAQTLPPPATTHPAAAGADLETLGERIAELSAHSQAATHQLLVMIREFDEGGGWNDGGCRSCAHWLNWRTGLDLGAARAKVRVARALDGLPLLSASMKKSEISYSKVRALTRVATAATEAELLDFARAGTAIHVERLVRAWRRVDRIEEMEHEERRQSGRSLTAYTDEDGMVVVRGRLTPEVGAALPLTWAPAVRCRGRVGRCQLNGLVLIVLVPNGLNPGTCQRMEDLGAYLLQWCALGRYGEPVRVVSGERRRIETQVDEYRPLYSLLDLFRNR